jgi:hypothetical protein
MAIVGVCLGLTWSPPEGELLDRRFNRHHRKMRGQRGENTLENVILACGSGTTGCHGYAHHHRAFAERYGLIVRSTANPADVQVVRGASALGERPVSEDRSRCVHCGESNRDPEGSPYCLACRGCDWCPSEETS